MYVILRNDQQYGPYTLDTLIAYVENGQILKCDQAFLQSDPQNVQTVNYFLRQNGKRVKIRNKSSLTEQLKDLGSKLIFPQSAFNRKHWIADRRLLVLAIIGLLPSLLMYIVFPFPDFVVFYAIALYFSIIWGLFFYYLFKTPQVSLKLTVILFFASQIFVFIAWDILGLPRLNPFYLLLKKESFLLTCSGYIFGVGLTEELAKAFPLFIIIAMAKKPLIPQTVVYYGLMSGIAFGVFEGVQYQMNVNIELDYSSGFYMNIARLTGLPFLHAIWCGLAGYFIAFAKLYPKYRYSLYFLAISIPSVLHGLYDSFCSSASGMFIALPVTFLGVVLLMTYLKQSVSYQSKLSK
jgi:RsiW-degrading membrane proteinase PrsW (M82 family)